MKRNLTVHTYQLDTLNDVLSIFDHFSNELANFVQHLETLS
jgi:hypothetical protein